MDLEPAATGFGTYLQLVAFSFLSFSFVVVPYTPALDEVDGALAAWDSRDSLICLLFTPFSASVMSKFPLPPSMSSYKFLVVRSCFRAPVFVDSHCTRIDHLFFFFSLRMFVPYLFPIGNRVSLSNTTYSMVTSVLDSKENNKVTKRKQQTPWVCATPLRLTAAELSDSSWVMCVLEAREEVSCERGVFNGRCDHQWSTGEQCVREICFDRVFDLRPTLFRQHIHHSFHRFMP
jgi:hypothetical protein